MGKQSRRREKKASCTTGLPDFDFLDVIPGWDSVHNYVLIEPVMLAHIRTLEGNARAEFVRPWVGEIAWTRAHKAFGLHQEHLANRHTDETP